MRSVLSLVLDLKIYKHLRDADYQGHNATVLTNNQIVDIYLILIEINHETISSMTNLSLKCVYVIWGKF